MLLTNIVVPFLSNIVENIMQICYYSFDFIKKTLFLYENKEKRGKKFVLLPAYVIMKSVATKGLLRKRIVGRLFHIKLK